MEERRLAHVGITRARKKLYITMVRYIQARFESHKVENPSIIVKDIIDHFIKNPPFEESDPCRVGRRRRQVIKVKRMDTTWREQCHVNKLWVTQGTEVHPHSLWNFLEEGEQDSQEESQ